ncbi:hypothetical protein TNCV_947801 [Trichonephila clavipes]|nr:hypothetical protein TNCV_947801 [Trichonephila clavipes]
MDPRVLSSSLCATEDVATVASWSRWWLACHEYKPSTTKDPPCSVNARINCRGIKRPPVGVVGLLKEGVPAQDSSSSLDHGSKL